MRVFTRELKAARGAGQAIHCDFFLSADEHGLALVVDNFDHKETAFRSDNDVYVMIRATKPEARHGKTLEVKAVGRMLGVKAFRVVTPRMIQEKTLDAFCRRHALWIKQLNLRGPDDIGITSGTIRFRWVSTDLADLEPRLKAFAGFVHAMVGTPDPAPTRVLFQREWQLKRPPKSKALTATSAHRLGGTFGCTVACAECGEATNLIAQLDLSDPCLPKTAMGRIKLPVFSCLACLDWGPAFYELSGAQPKPVRADGRVLKGSELPGNDEDLSPQPLTLCLTPKGKKIGRTSKLGGSPVWVQTAQTPSCPRCKHRMTFLMQLASNAEFTFGDAGLLYAFVCPKCKIVASLIQSH